MTDHTTVRTMVLKEKIEGWRRHRRLDAGTARNRTRKHGFASAQLAAQREHDGCGDGAADLLTPRDQLRFVEVERAYFVPAVWPNFKRISSSSSRSSAARS